GALMLECIRQFRLELEERGLPDDRRRKLARALARHLERDETVAGPPFQPLTKQAASAIRARFAAPNRAIAERYFDRTMLFSGIAGIDAAERHVVAPEDALANPAYAAIRGELLGPAARGQD
ncbi:MAG: hypothetical protein LC634_00860, partial [Sphingomonadales bacterium]|nr:hypothetical protein [Sphingomonadales bacterium]